MSSGIGYTFDMTQISPLTPEELAQTSCPRPGPKGLHAIALVQEKWTLRIIQVLSHGPAGFNEMSRNAGRVNSTTLAQRLGQLERAGLVRKTVQSTMPPRTSYELTEAGLALGPIIVSIAEWGERYLQDLPADCEGE
jgi:DNA-binding HxlR family transcriptional regulator